MYKICFIASSGGHFEQLLMLKGLMHKYESFIVTEKTNYDVKEEMKTYYLRQINRKEWMFGIKLIFNTILSIIIFLKERPDLIISTGVLASIPMCFIAKLFNRKIIYIESFAKINSRTLTGKLLYSFADLFIIQWESLLKHYPNATFGGGIY